MLHRTDVKAPNDHWAKSFRIIRRNDFAYFGGFLWRGWKECEWSGRFYEMSVSESGGLCKLKFVDETGWNAVAWVLRRGG